MGKRSPDLAAERFAAQLLSGPPGHDVLGPVSTILAVQAQDPAGARLAIRARTTGLLAADVDRALSVERSVVISWLNRGTLHLVAAEDYWWLHALTTPPIVPAVRRRLLQEGVAEAEAERGVRLIRVSLENGPMTGIQLRQTLQQEGIRVAGQAFIQLAAHAALQGVIVRGPMLGKQHAYVLAADWLPARRPFDREKALAELARRYLAGHAPATERDLARWAGITLGAARQALESVAGDITVDAEGLVRLRQAQRPHPPSPTRLLGAFEPALLGWASRRWIIGDHEWRLVNGGMFRPFALATGRAVAVWQRRAGIASVDRFAAVTPVEARALAADQAEVERFFGAQPAAAASRAAKPPQTRAAR